MFSPPAQLSYSGAPAAGCSVGRELHKQLLVLWVTGWQAATAAKLAFSLICSSCLFQHPQLVASSKLLNRPVAAPVQLVSMVDAESPCCCFRIACQWSMLNLPVAAPAQLVSMVFTLVGGPTVPGVLAHTMLLSGLHVPATASTWDASRTNHNSTQVRVSLRTLAAAVTG